MAASPPGQVNELIWRPTFMGESIGRRARTVGATGTGPLPGHDDVAR